MYHPNVLLTAYCYFKRGRASEIIGVRRLSPFEWQLTITERRLVDVGLTSSRNRQTGSSVDHRCPLRLTSFISSPFEFTRGPRLRIGKAAGNKLQWVISGPWRAGNSLLRHLAFIQRSWDHHQHLEICTSANGGHWIGVKCVNFSGNSIRIFVQKFRYISYKFVNISRYIWCF